MFALSFESKWRVPADLSGGTLLLSDLLCLIYDQKHFMQFWLAFWFNLSVVLLCPLYISSKLFFSCHCVSCLSCLYFVASFLFPDFFLHLYNLSCYLMSLLRSLFIQGHPSFCFAVLCGMFDFMLSSTLI